MALSAGMLLLHCLNMKGRKISDCFVHQLKRFQNISGLHTACTFLWHIVSLGTPSYPGGISVFSVFISVWLSLNLVCVMVPIFPL